MTEQDLTAPESADGAQTNPEAPAASAAETPAPRPARPRKTATKAASPRKTAAKKVAQTSAEEAPAEKPPAKKAPAKRAPAKKPAQTAATKTATKKVAQTPAEQAPVKRAPASKAPAKKAVARKPAPTPPPTGKRAAAKRTARSVAGLATSAVESATTAARGSDDPAVVAPRRLSGFDLATWRTASADPAMRSPIIGLIALEGSPDWARLVERFDRATRVAPVLRQKVLEGPTDVLSPRLVIDPDFDLSFHMRRFRVADPGTWDQVLDECRRQSMADFDMARPLWRVTLLEGLQDGRAALIVKLHHAIADGQGAMMLGATVIDLSPEDQDLGPMPPEPVSVPMDTAAFLGTAVADASGFLVRSAKDVADAALPIATRALKDPVGAVEDIVNVMKSVSRFLAVPTRPMSPVMTRRSINYHFVTFDVPLRDLKAAAKAHGLTLNDAFMGGVTGGLRIYHEALDEPVALLRCNMPISLRDPQRPAQNAVTIARFEVPVGIVDPVERMHAIHEIVDRWRQEPALHLADPLAEVGTAVLPMEVFTSAAQKSDFTASNVPGVPVPVFVGGARVIAMYPMTGTIGAATNITLLSYNGNAGLGISMDDAAIPDRELFIESMGLGFAEVVGHPVPPSDPLAG